MLAVSTAAAFCQSSVGLDRVFGAICLTVVAALVSLAWVQSSGRVELAENIAAASFFSSIGFSFFATPSDAKLVIEDDGPGMCKANLERFFDPFFTTRQAGEGRGLGLSISHETVRAHGGEIRVGFQPVSGPRFEVWLPL